MEKKTFSSSVSAHKEASNYDEIFMRHSLLFTENLKDLKNIRKQLHTAADYFELSYGKDDQKQLMLETLKDYIAKAIVNTVDHLGSVAYKVNTFLDEKVNEMSKTEIQFSCIEQRIQISREISDHCGRSQQSFLIKTAKHHKQYMIPEKILGIGKTKSVYTSCSPCAEYDSYRSKNGKILSSIADAASSPETFSFTTTTLS